MMKFSITTQAIDILIGDEEQNGKQKREKRERNREAVPQPSYPGPFGHLLLPIDHYMDHSETIFSTQTNRGNTHTHIIIINFT